MESRVNLRFLPGVEKVGTYDAITPLRDEAGDFWAGG
jgi:hypothetical protein